MFDYWRVQSEKMLFPEIAWSKPEQKSHAGKLLIVGGSSGNFRALVASYDSARRAGVGQIKVLVPDSLKKVLKIESRDLIFAPSNQSGGFSSEALSDLIAAGQWADAIILIGDAGQNSETAILFEKFILKTEKPTTIARDAVDILIASANSFLGKPNITVFASFAQLQKIFSTVFYPKVLTFSMQLSNLVETLHKFTLTYPCVVATFHAENLIVAQNGQIFSSPASSKTAKFSPLSIWSGQTPTEVAVWQIWNQSKKLEASITAVSRDI